MMNRIAEMLTELKDTSEMMIDLAYSSLLYDNTEIAEEVIALSNSLDGLYERTQDEIIKSSQNSPGEVARAIVTVTLMDRIMDLAHAAESIADVVLRGLAEHPVLAMSIRESDTTMCLAKVADDSVLAGKTFGEVSLSTVSGMFVIAVRRGDDYIFGPGEDTKMEAGDILIARGPEESVSYFKDIADGTEKDLS
ncbi:MAG: potassium channel family protein [Methanomethylophilus sp.]|jgi:uncharacterized protein with PhoU and TrkA domain